jgi:hypothetical protein
MRVLLLDLEAIEQVMVEKQNKKLKAKGKAATAHPDAKSNPKKKASGGSSDQNPKKACSEKLCQQCKHHIGPYKHATPWTAAAMKAMVSPSCQQQVNLSPRNPTRSLGPIRVWPHADHVQDLCKV